MRGSTNAIVNDAAGINIHDTKAISGSVQDMDLQSFSEELVDHTGTYTNTKVTRATRVIEINLTTEWQTVSNQAYKYVQTVSVDANNQPLDIINTDRPVISLNVGRLSQSAANVKAANKAFGFIDRAITGNGTITFYCYNNNPKDAFNATLPVQVKGF